MKRHWINGKDAISITIMAVLSFFVESTIGLVLLPLVAIPLVGGFASGFIDAMIIFLAIFLVPRKGAALLFGIILLTLSTITPSFGPPGIYKILIGIGLGLIIEVVLMIIGRKPYSYIIATAIAFGGSIPMTYWAWEQFGISTDKLRPYFYIFTGIYSILGLIGAFSAYLLYKKRLSRFAIIRKTREE